MFCCIAFLVAVPSWLFASPDLEDIFLNPPEVARPRVLWMWMGSNISRQGITDDLEALHEAGFGGCILFSLADTCIPWAGVIENSPTPDVIAFSEPWWKLVRHAAAESQRLGLDFGMHNCPGYESSGGPWITPELSMQQLVWSEQSVQGPTQFAGVVARPQPDLRAVQPYPLVNPTNGRLEKPEIPARRGYYRDIAVLALPATGTVAPDQVIDLTPKMANDGRLEWDAPPGNWTIYRFGHTTKGKLLQPGQWEAIGLECDKMSGEAVEFHLNHIISEAKRHLGEHFGKGFKFYHFDSYEAGTPDWTPRMSEEFQSRRGYKLTSFLPTFAKRVVGSQDEVAKFHTDFHQTIRDLYRENYFPVIAKALHSAGLEFMCEPYGGPWTIEEVVPQVDRIVTEFWTHGGKYNPYELAPTVAAVRSARRNIIEAEAFTGAAGDSQWSETPAWLKSIGDASFCDGVNRQCLHRFTHQPFDEQYRPGQVMGQWGTHFDRTQTWWEPGKAWVRYLTRCQALLQWGEFVSADNDFVVTFTSTSPIDVRAIHRREGNIDVYFVANLPRQAGKASCTFAVSGRQPELWNPVTSAIRELPEYSTSNGQTTIPLEFEDSESAFIVFRKQLKDTVKPPGKNFADYSSVLELSGPWVVRFDPAWGGPREVTFDKLEDWTARQESGIKYYSGTARYECKFDLPAGLDGTEHMWLDLGTVKDIAEVRLNGRELGVLWTAPWQVEVTNALKPGINSLEIRVTNTWANRLIGDEQEPADCQWGKGEHGFGGPLKEYPDWLLKNEPRPSLGRYTFVTWNYFKHDSQLQPSGLLGPVRIQMQSRQ